MKLLFIISGYATTHKVKNLLIQELDRHFGKPFEYAIQHEGKRRIRSFKPSLKRPDVIGPSSSKRIGPSGKDFQENLEQDMLFAEVDENTFLWSLLSQSCSYVQGLPILTGFNITINPDTPVLKFTVSYLDCIGAPATEITIVYQVAQALSFNK